MQMTTGFGMTSIMPEISTTGGSFRYRGAVFTNYKLDLRTVTGRFCLFHNWASEGEKVVPSRFDLQSGRGGTVEVKSSGIKVGETPFNCSRGSGHRGVTVGVNSTSDKGTTFYGSI